MFLTVSVLTIASSHSPKDRPNQSQWLCFNAFNLNVPYFLSLLISILIFCLSPSLSPFSVRLCLFLCFLSVTIFLIFSQSLCMRRHTKNEDKGRDSQKMRTEMETNRKWRKRWRWAENKEKDGDKRKIKRMIDQGAETLAPSYKW